jgi:DNA polymerase III delta subunit
MLTQVLETTPMELLVAMLARHLRDLYWVLEGGAGMNLPSWRAGKLHTQAVKFTKETLQDTINALAEIDIKSKTSDTDARFLFEILIAEKFV